MKSIYIGSASGYSGKSLVSICLGKLLQEQGRRVGYFKPFGTLPAMHGDAVVDEDALAVRAHLGLEDDLNDMSPVVLTHDMNMKMFRGETGDIRGRIDAAYKAVSKDKDVVIIGGGRTLSEGRSLGVPSQELISDYDWRCLIIDRYFNKVSLDIILAYKNILKDRMAGLILNRVEQQNRSYVEKLVIPFLGNHGITVLGLMPDDATLSAVSVEALSTALGGEVMSAEHKKDMLVHNFVVGAMSVEQACRRFRRRQNKAVITGGDRMDLQVAALETSTSVLILTGGISPHPMILSKADEVDVPVIVVQLDTMGTIEKIEQLMGRPRMKEAEKIDRAMVLFRDNVDISPLGL